jgi:hypothetical protein
MGVPGGSLYRQVRLSGHFLGGAGDIPDQITSVLMGAFSALGLGERGHLEPGGWGQRRDLVLSVSQVARSGAPASSHAVMR